MSCKYDVVYDKIVAFPSESCNYYTHECGVHAEDEITVDISHTAQMAEHSCVHTDIMSRRSLEQQLSIVGVYSCNILFTVLVIYSLHYHYKLG